jgi:UDPglucose--hexose-1-phosphate uridylyltransferase
LPDLSSDEKAPLTELLSRLLSGYGWHGAPTGGDGTPTSSECWQLHGDFYPPLLRSATVKKFLAGYEMLSEPQRDITPEQAAERLRESMRLDPLPTP